MAINILKFAFPKMHIQRELLEHHNIAVGILIAGVILAITIVGLPWTPAAFRLAGFSYWPFGRVVVDRDTGPVSLVLNIGLDMLGSNNPSPVDFLSRYQRNDRIRGGVAYAF